jgi:uncharacterized protein (DUF983 family)
MSPPTPVCPQCGEERLVTAWRWGKVIECACDVCGWRWWQLVTEGG